MLGSNPFITRRSCSSSDIPLSICCYVFNPDVIHLHPSSIVNTVITRILLGCVTGSHWTGGFHDTTTPTSVQGSDLRRAILLMATQEFSDTVAFAAHFSVENQYTIDLKQDIMTYLLGTTVTEPEDSG